MKRAAGYLGSAVALGFIGWLLFEHWGRLPAVDLSSGQVAGSLTACLCLYVLTQVLAAIGWRFTLGALGQERDHRLVESELLVSQIGKYIPGNVAHLLGRLALARADGVAGWAASVAMALEITLLLGVGALYIVILLAAMPDLMAELAQDLKTRTGLIYGLAGALVALLGIATIVMIGRVSRNRSQNSGKIDLARLIGPVFIHVVNNLLLGISLFFAARAVMPEVPLSIGFCTVVFVTAWVTGFLTPGAPGGLGVRDGLIALGLGMVVSAANGLGIALLHRAISVLGDLIVFGLGLSLRKYFTTNTESRTS